MYTGLQFLVPCCHFIFLGGTVHAQWTPTNLGAGNINTVFVNGNDLLAGMNGGSGALYTPDDGANWVMPMPAWPNILMWGLLPPPNVYFFRNYRRCLPFQQYGTYNGILSSIMLVVFLYWLTGRISLQALRRRCLPFQWQWCHLDSKHYWLGSISLCYCLASNGTYLLRELMEPAVRWLTAFSVPVTTHYLDTGQYRIDKYWYFFSCGKRWVSFCRN